MAYDKSSLTLFSNKNASGNNPPVMRGFVELKSNELKWIAGELKAGRTGKLRVTVWKRVSQKSNQQFLSGVIEPDTGPPPRQNAAADFDIDSFGGDDIVL